MARTLRRLSPRHHRAVALRLAGESPQTIADILGVQRRTIYLWFSAPLIKAEVARLTDEVAQLVAQQLARDTLTAGNRPRDERDAPPPDRD